MTLFYRLAKLRTLLGLQKRRGVGKCGKSKVIIRYSNKTSWFNVFEQTSVFGLNIKGQRTFVIRFWLGISNLRNHFNAIDL